VRETMAPSPFDNARKKKKFKKDAEEKKKRTLLVSKSRDREHIYRTLNNVVEIDRLDKLSGKKTPVSRGSFIISDATITSELSDLVVGTDGSEPEFQILKVEEKTQMIYLERYLDPDSGEAVWNYDSRGNSHKLMAELINDGLCGLINCFYDDERRQIKRKDGREVSVEIETYNGVPVRRLDG